MNKNIFTYIVLFLVASSALYYFSSKKPMQQQAPEQVASSTPEPTQVSIPAEKTVTFTTNKGDITLELFTDKMPITTGNFIKLAKEGYYTNTKFHRVIANFMVQGGDTLSKGDDTSKYGTGGPGYNIQDEFVAGLSNVRGTISMANTGAPHSGGSQFFINLVDNTGLDFDKPPFTSSHPVFGKVISGMDVVDAIAKVQTNSAGLPAEAIVIEAVEVR
jgi:peptidylprolyl isomerase